MRVACQYSHVLSLWPHPLNITNLLTYVKVFEGVEVGMVSLELIVVVVLLTTLKLLGRVEYDEATCPIT